MLGYYNYTVYLTYLGMMISFFGILSAVQGDMQAALLCLMLSGFCDMFDGKIASTRPRTAQEKQFGIQIDSLSDLICFGVLPAIIVSMLCAKTTTTCIAAIYLLCALIRLAYFNVEEAERQSQTQLARNLYRGLPVTTSALILPAVFCTTPILPLSNEQLCPAALCCMAIAFITPFQLKKPATVGKLLMLILGSTLFIILLRKGGL